MYISSARKLIQEVGMLSVWTLGREGLSLTVKKRQVPWSADGKTAGSRWYQIIADVQTCRLTH